jgi:ribonuclease HII
MAGDTEQSIEPQADGTYLAVAAASILAKEARDAMVKEACTADPSLDEKYGLLKSKGYGTAAHRAAIQKHGMHVWHRRLFLRKLLGLEHVAEEAELEAPAPEKQYHFLEED